MRNHMKRFQCNSTYNVVHKVNLGTMYFNEK